MTVDREIPRAVAPAAELPTRWLVVAAVLLLSAFEATIALQVVGPLRATLMWSVGVSAAGSFAAGSCVRLRDHRGRIGRWTRAHAAVIGAPAEELLAVQPRRGLLTAQLAAAAVTTGIGAVTALLTAYLSRHESTAALPLAVTNLAVGALCGFLASHTRPVD